MAGKALFHWIFARGDARTRIVRRAPSRVAAAFVRPDPRVRGFANEAERRAAMSSSALLMVIASANSRSGNHSRYRETRPVLARLGCD